MNAPAHGTQARHPSWRATMALPTACPAGRAPRSAAATLLREAGLPGLATKSGNTPACARCPRLRSTKR
ncbi:MAG: hypothetical protein WDN04_09680 [Rhodospirillales bacterium]